MKRTAVMGILLLMLAAAQMPAAALTGIYLAFASSASSRLFSPSGTRPADFTQSRSRIALFASLYDENFFEITLSLARDSHYLEGTESFRPRTQVGFEAGGVFSLKFFSRGRVLLSPDFSAGLFYRFDFMSTGGGGDQKMESEWGLYGACKVKIPLSRRPLRLRSLDVGYKVSLPAHFSYAPEETTVLTTVHSLFVGVSL